jgi:hypothetical protein
MRFDRHVRYEPLTLTERKVKAFQRKQAKERARYPLFSDHIADEQHSVEDEATKRATLADKFMQERRDFLAEVWRKSRKLYFSQPDSVRVAIRDYWKAWRGPVTAIYFASVVDDLSGERERRCAAIEKERRPLIEKALLRLKVAESGDLFS